MGNAGGLGALGAVRSVPGAPRLFAGALVGRLPEGMQSLALLLFFRHAYDSYALAGGMVALFALAGAGLTPFVGPMVARWGAVRVITVFAVVQASALASILVAVQLEAALVVVMVAVLLGGLFSTPVSACARAAWKEAAPTPDVRDAGFTFDAVSQELLWLGGPGIVSVCLLVAGPQAALGATAALIVGGAAYFVTSPLLARRPAPTLGMEAWEVAPRPEVWRSAQLRVLLMANGAVGLGFGFTEVAVPALAEHLGAPSAAGVLVAAMSAGSLAGGFGYGARTWRTSLKVRHTASALALAAATCTLAAAGTLAWAVVLAFVAGAPWSPLLATQYARFAEDSSAQATVAVFTWATTCALIGMAVGAAASGAMVEWLGSSAAFLAAGASFVVVSALVSTTRATARPRGR